MANITIINGTDGISASRPVINANFAAINDQLISLSGLLDEDTSSLNITGAITAGSLSLTGKLTVGGSINAEVGLNTNKVLSINGGIVKANSGVITSMVPANQYTYSTYRLDTAVISGNAVVNSAANGQEVTLIAVNGSLSLSSANFAGVSGSIVVNSGGTITIRFIDSEWYIISSFNATITV